MPLTEVEREITKTVVARFLNLKESTRRKSLVIKFKEPETLDRLVKCAILKTHDNETFLPMALAFHYCGDMEALRLAKRSVEVVVYVLQNLFEAYPDRTDLTPADVEAHARSMYDNIETETIKLGLYLAQEFGGVLAAWGGQTEITSLRVSERIVTLRNIEHLWDDHVRQYSAYLEAPSPHTADAESSAMTGILVLISHSGRDVDLASELTELLRTGIGLRAEQIRCSSVDGYRLPGGVNTEAQLRKEINLAKVLVGLITPNSLSSAYVLFELGARWGAGLFMIPLLAGIKPEEMRGPLSLLNALSCSSEGQLHQLLADVAVPLGLSVESPASYLRYITAVKGRAEAISAATVPTPAVQEKMVFEERKRTARGQLAKLETFERETLRELVIRGEMLESHATEYVDSRNLGHFAGILNSIQGKTSFVNHDFTGQYRINPAFREVLKELLLPTSN